MAKNMNILTRSFLGEIKRTFFHFERALTEAKKTNFFLRWESQFKIAKLLFIQLSCYPPIKLHL